MVRLVCDPVAVIWPTGIGGCGRNCITTEIVTGNNVTGNFTYTPAAGIVLNVGTHTLHVDFTPNDTEKYTNATADVTINVSEKPVANFTADPTQGDAPLTVQFNDSSENATAWNWNFGDGQTSTDQNPSHTYYSLGTYTVSLNASNSEGFKYLDKIKFNYCRLATTLVTNGLVAYYDGNLSGNSLIDLSGNNNIGYATSVTQGTNQELVQIT